MYPIHNKQNKRTLEEYSLLIKASLRIDVGDYASMLLLPQVDQQMLARAYRNLERNMSKWGGIKDDDVAGKRKYFKEALRYYIKQNEKGKNH